MKLQKWIVYKKTGNELTDIGVITTSVSADNRTAWAKASHKYIGKPYTIGWSLHVRKANNVIN
jgi:hypothetical protein